MRNRIFPMITLAALAVSPLCAQAAETPAAELTAPGKPQAAKKEKAKSPPLTFRLGQTLLLDSNIEQDKTDVSSRGFVTFLRARYREKLKPGTVTLDYEVAKHSYTRSNTWDRTSQVYSGSLEHRFSRMWSTETILEAALKGASDDREIRDEYTAGQRVEYALSKTHHVRVDGAWRKRKYDDDPGKNSLDPYYGINFDTRWRDGGNWTLGYRRDRNRADDGKFTYVRATISSELKVPLGERDELNLEAKYRTQRYPERKVISGMEIVNRRDRRWIVESALKHDIDRNLEVDLTYRLETRRSNDLKREFDDNTFGVTMMYRW